MIAFGDELIWSNELCGMMMASQSPDAARDRNRQRFSGEKFSGFPTRIFECGYASRKVWANCMTVALSTTSIGFRYRPSLRAFHRKLNLDHRLTTSDLLSH